MGGDNAARPPDPPERAIAAALSAQHLDLLLTSALFQSSIEALADLLVPMVQGLADAARAAETPTRPAGSTPRIVPLDERRQR